MKNKIKYFIVIPVLILLLISVISNVDIVALGVRLVFGESYWKDSLTNTIVTNKSIRLQPGDSLYYGTNSVAVSAGGGDVNSGSNNTFSGSNTFSGINTFSNGTYFNDSVKFTRIVIADSIKSGVYKTGTGKITDAANTMYFNEQGYDWQTTYSNSLMTLDSANGLNVKKNFGAISDSLVTSSKVFFNDSVKALYYLKADSLFARNVNLTNAGGIINWTSGGLSQIYQVSNAIYFKQNEFDFISTTSNSIMTVDSLNGLKVRKPIEGLSDTVTSASKWEFSDIVTFSLSPVFSALVTFANGVNVTGNLYVSGFTRQGELSRNEKKVTKAVYMNSTNFTYTVAHGISRVENVTSVKLTILHDSTGAAVPQILPQGYNATTPQAVGNSVWLDSLNCNYYLATTSYGLIGDSAKFEITYTDAY